MRFGVSMDRELVRLLDRMTQASGYANRSETLRALVRQEATRQTPVRDRTESSESAGRDGAQEDVCGSVTGIVSFIYRRGIPLREVPVSSLQILSNLKLHLRPQLVLTVIVLQGDREDVYSWGQQVIRQRNVMGDISIVASQTVLEVMEGGDG
jgi:metal-responsive CopG/Arc/MetJ family transcriptional regulator